MNCPPGRRRSGYRNLAAAYHTPAPCRLRPPCLQSSLHHGRVSAGRAKTAAIRERRDHGSLKDQDMRPSRRQPDELRAVSLERGVAKYAECSRFVRFRGTHVLVTATLEDRLPPALKGEVRALAPAEYGMQPCTAR